MKGHDYAQAGLYFITICCQDRICRFGHVENGEMVLNEYGNIANDEWLRTPILRPNVKLHEYVVMPNHIHGIIQLLDIGRGEMHSPNIITPDNVSANIIASDDITHNNIFPDIILSDNVSPNIITPNIIMYDKISDNNKPNDNGHVGNDNQDVCNDNRDVGNDNGNICNGGVRKTPLQLPSQTIGAIVRGYKSSVTKQINMTGEYDKPIQLWQRNYYEHIIRNEKSYQRISEYIINNPAKWTDDKFYK